MRSAIVMMVMGALMHGACSDEGLNPTGIPKLEVSEGQRLIASGSTVLARADLPARIQVANSGTDVLRLKEIVLVSVPPGAFTLISLPTPTEEVPIEVWPEALAHSFSIAFDPALVPAGASPSATVTLRTNTTINSGSEFTFHVAPAVTVARLVVSPSILDFGTVAASSTSTKTSNLLNTGAVSLTINRMIFAGHPGYSARIGGNTFTVTTESAAAGITLSPPLVIAAGNAEKVDVTYAASGVEGAQGAMVFFTDDPNDTSGTTLKLYSNLEGPCIKTNPSRVAFGGKLVGQSSEIALEIQSCGDIDLVISDVEMIEDANGLFGVRESAIGTYPVTLPAGSSVYLPVTYFPTIVAQLDGAGQFPLDYGKLRIKSNAYLAELDVPVEGFGTDGSCPVADIVVREGDEVLPQTVLHLSAAGSTAPNGAVSGYEWTVVQPGGSVSSFVPSASAQEVTFEANIVGEYIFRLSVTDAFGTRSCSAAEKSVVVTSDDAIHVELLWRTPLDPDESDTSADPFSSAGSDVDLHFLHPDAFGRYFEFPYDCYWDNTNPEWGVFSPSDNPRLDRDDTDGGGPENLNMAVPEQGRRYQVGVHYWDTWGYGNAFATVRVYIYGVLRDQWVDIKLDWDDMWDTHYIDWPSGAVTRIGSSPRITPAYLGL